MCRVAPTSSLGTFPIHSAQGEMITQSLPTTISSITRSLERRHARFTPNGFRNLPRTARMLVDWMRVCFVHA